MSFDGRGGARQGAGRPKKPKIDTETGEALNVLPDLKYEKLGADFTSNELDEWMTAPQKRGEVLKTQEVYDQVCNWLDMLECRGTVAPQLVEEYAMSVARWIQCEQNINEHGLLMAHPTKGTVETPYVAMSQSYMKQANQIWYNIEQIVKDQISMVGKTNKDDMMENLLKLKKG